MRRNYGPYRVYRRNSRIPWIRVRVLLQFNLGRIAVPRYGHIDATTRKVPSALEAGRDRPRELRVTGSGRAGNCLPSG